MHAHSDYKIEITSGKDNVAAVAELLADSFGNDEFNKEDFIQNCAVYIKETYNVVYVEDITDLATAMATIAPKSAFTIEGVVDTSESAGEYMNFLITYADGELKEHSSNWYMYPDELVQFMTYEEYCDDYGDEYTEDDFEKMQKGWFIVEKSLFENELMESVPLDQVRIIELKEE